MVLLVPESNIGPLCRLHEKYHLAFSNGNVLQSRLPLVRIPGMFLQNRFYLLDGRRVFLPEDLVGDDSRKHVAGNVPSRSGKR